MPAIFDNDMKIKVNKYGTPISADCPTCHGTDNENGYCCTACQVRWAEAQGEGDDGVDYDPSYNPYFD